MSDDMNLEQPRGDFCIGYRSPRAGKIVMCETNGISYRRDSAERGIELDSRNGAVGAKSPDSELSVIEITCSRASNHCSNLPLVRDSGQRSERRGEKVNEEVMAPRHRVPEHAFCMLAHDLVNKVSAIIGYCDLLETDQTETEKQIHLSRVRVTALLIADILNERPCSVVVCSADQEQPVKVRQKKPAENTEPEVFGRSGALYATI